MGTAVIFLFLFKSSARQSNLKLNNWSINGKSKIKCKLKIHLYDQDGMTGFVAELENCFVEFNGVVSLGDDHARASGRHIIGHDK